MARYTRDFKVEALQLSDQIGVRPAAEKLGIARSTLLKWRKSHIRPGLDAYSESLKEQEKTALKIGSLEQELSELKKMNSILLDTIHSLSSALAN